MMFSHLEAVNKVVQRTLKCTVRGKKLQKTMFLPSPNPSGFVLGITMTACPKATVSLCFCACWSLHAQFALPIKQNLSLHDSKYNSEIVGQIESYMSMYECVCMFVYSRFVFGP